MVMMTSHGAKVDLWSGLMQEQNSSRVDLVAHGHCHLAIRPECLDWQYERLIVALSAP